MKGLDTNVLVRFLVKDQARQARTAARFIRRHCSVESPCHINRFVLCELAWVLDSAYRYSRAIIADVIDKVLRTGEFVVEDADEAWAALRAYRDGRADFADVLLGATNLARGCDTTATFDRVAGRLEAFDLLER